MDHNLLRCSARIEALPTNPFRELTRFRNELAPGRRIIDLSEGDPDVPPHPELLEYLSGVCRRSDQHSYPSRSGIKQLRSAFDRFLVGQYDVAPGRFETMPVSGTKEAFAHLCQALIRPGEVVLLPRYHYPIYPVAASYAGGRVVCYETDERGFPVFDLLSHTDVDAARLLVINYPTNPTGAMVERTELEHILGWAKRNGIIVCSDMAYAEIVSGDQPAPSLLSISQKNDLVVELHSFSKSLSVPGWRIGLAAGSADILSALEQSKAVFDTGVFFAIQNATAYALSHFNKFSSEIKATYARRRDLAQVLLPAREFGYTPPDGGFYLWIRTTNGAASDRCGQLLQEHGLLLMPGKAFGDEHDEYFRVSLTQPDQVISSAITTLSNYLPRSTARSSSC